MTSLKNNIKNLPPCTIDIDASQLDGMRDSDLRSILVQILATLVDLDTRIAVLEAANKKGV